MVNLKGKDITRPVRAIIDTGSHRSYISNGAAKEMSYEILRTEELTHALFGGLSSEVTSHNCYRVYLENPDKSYTCRFEALGQSVICTNVLGIRNDPWMKELQDHQNQRQKPSTYRKLNRCRSSRKTLLW